MFLFLLLQNIFVPKLLFLSSSRAVKKPPPPPSQAFRVKGYLQKSSVRPLAWLFCIQLYVLFFWLQLQLEENNSIFCFQQRMDIHWMVNMHDKCYFYKTNLLKIQMLYYTDIIFTDLSLYIVVIIYFTLFWTWNLNYNYPTTVTIANNH